MKREKKGQVLMCHDCKTHKHPQNVHFKSTIKHLMVKDEELGLKIWILILKIISLEIFVLDKGSMVNKEKKLGEIIHQQ